VSETALTIVELDIETCGLTYGVAPCEAELGVTGEKKCFNCRNTCQDIENFDPETVTLRFIEDNGFAPKAIEAFPSLRDASLSPAVVSLGEDLGVRASFSASFKDHPHSDTGPGFDQYRADRAYDPYLQGTFWGKFRARQPFLRGRAIRLIRGFLPETFETEYPMGTPLPADVLSRQDTRHFVVESFDGVTPEGMFAITAKDILKFADGDRAQAPRLSQGRLLANITDAATSLALSPADIGDEEYPLHGLVAIGGKEIVYFFRDPYNGLNASTELLLRFSGAQGSTTMTDSSGKGRNGTAQGNAQLGTDNFAWGPSALVLDGIGDYVTVADNAAWAFGTANFTIDAVLSPDELSGIQSIGTHSSNTLSNFWRLYLTATGAVGFEIVASSVTTFSLVSGAGAVAADEFQNVSIVRNGNVWNIRVDGVTVATTTNAVTVPNFSSTLRIGTNGNASGDFFKGAIQQFRIQSAAFWTADFPDDVPGGYNDLGPDGMTIARAQKNTPAQSHSAQDRVQRVLSYVGEDPADIISDLLINYADTPAEYIPIEAWRGETLTYLSQVLTVDIAEPVAVNKLIGELVKQAALCLWTDERVPEIKLRVLRAVPADAARYDETIYLARSPQSREQPDKRVSQVWTYYGKRNPLEGEEDADNYRAAVLTVDADTESSYGSPVIEKIFSRWIPFGGRVIAEAVNAIRLSRFRIPPRKVNFSLFKTIEVEPELGTGCRISHPSMQDDEGARVDVPLQITRLNPTAESFEIEAEEMLGGAEAIDLSDRKIYVDSDIKNVNLKALHDSIYQEVTEDDVLAGVTLTLIVLENIRLGSSSTASPALDCGDSGDWPAGFDITIEVSGLLAGKGGNGRSGGRNTSGGQIPPQSGLPGGVAIFTRFPIKIAVKDGGKLGGGGGAGGGGAYWVSTISAGGGGGSGAGYDPGVSIDPYRPGDPGTDLFGGDGRTGSSGAFTGGDGGDLGQDGEPGGGQPGNAGAAEGVAGAAIDGISYCTILEGDASILGPRVN
jgi:hypothetical protein